jgi:hypothetical protein
LDERLGNFWKRALPVLNVVSSVNCEVQTGDILMYRAVCRAGIQAMMVMVVQSKWLASAKDTPHWALLSKGILSELSDSEVECSTGTGKVPAGCCAFDLDFPEKALEL